MQCGRPELVEIRNVLSSLLIEASGGITDFTPIKMNRGRATVVPLMYRPIIPRSILSGIRNSACSIPEGCQATLRLGTVSATLFKDDDDDDGSSVQRWVRPRYKHPEIRIS